MVISIITIIFLLHPTITTSALGIFQCIDVDEGVSRVRIDLAIECYSTEHIFWSLSLGVPMLIVWVFGCPALALFILTKKRKHLDDHQVKRYFIVIYQGLKHKKYYWEFVNMVRKILLLSLNVFLSKYSNVYKGGVAILVVIVIYRIQIKLKPYILRFNND